MPQDPGVIEDTIYGTVCTFYSTSLPNCGWGNEEDAVEFATVENAEAAAEDMNQQIGAASRFIGRRPKPH